MKVCAAACSTVGASSFNFTDTFEIDKLRSFIDMLSPEQRIMFELLGGQPPVSPSDMERRVSQL